MFRHDTTLLSLLLRKNVKDLKTHSVEKYANDSLPGTMGAELGPDVIIRNFRMNYRTLPYARPRMAVNKIIVGGFFKLKQINRIIKRLP